MAINTLLEQISDTQKMVSNRLLSLALEETCNEHKLSHEGRKLRQVQADNFNKKMFNDHNSESWSFDTCVANWWSAESERTDLNTEAKIYRALVMFGRNYNLCPFTKIKKNLIGRTSKSADTDYFEKTMARHFQSFCEKSVTTLKPNKLEAELIKALDALATYDLDKSIYSARYALLNKDKTILKGVAIGASMGIITSLFLGPVVGGMIGEAAGLSGAAATSYGMALLGGGSIASGGFGMAGGSVVLGVMFGGANVAKDLDQSVDIDLLNLCQAKANIPVLLSTGRILRELGHVTISNEINSLVTVRSRELEDRKTHLLRTNEQNEDKIKNVKESLETFQRAKEFSKFYDWTTGYDLFKKVAS